MRLIAHYLPQFYATPYNNEWWGEGFTEWVNVSRAKPQYIDHFQPRLPHENIGKYCLEDDAVRHSQAAMAKKYGIDAWAYYYYRFDGKRVLEMPLQRHFEDKSLDMPFCICWANENWTRRWDGRDKEVLLEQKHSRWDDLGFITSVSKMLLDPRYVRIDGKPVIMIYRTELWENIKDAVKTWRQYMRETHSTEIYLIRCDGFSSGGDPRLIGFDASYQFPPLQFSNGNEARGMVATNAQFKGGIPAYSNWRKFVTNNPPYKLFRGVMPSWDNTPRRMDAAHIFYGSSPAEYKQWLDAAISFTVEHMKGDEQIVFINAWNEWAEGAVLEPCQQWGYGFLEATLESRKNVR